LRHVHKLGKIVHAGEVLHGKTSKIYHDGKGLFKGVPDGVEAIRYHSLAADPSTIDSSILEVTSKTSKGIIMGLRHKHFKMECVQFHPESIKTEYGMQMLKNFLEFQS
jgi:anthranilate/para-aminobenzoate synthase component II